MLEKANMSKWDIKLEEFNSTKERILRNWRLLIFRLEIEKLPGFYSVPRQN